VSKRSRVRHLLSLPLIVGLPLIGLLAWLGLAYQIPHSEEDAVALAGATSPVTSLTGDVQIRTWASREVIRSGDTFEVWVLVKNNSHLPLQKLEIKTYESPGFVPIGTCWRGGVPGCRPGMPPASQPVGLEQTLAPGLSGMAFAELKSAGSTKDKLTASIAWVAAGKAQEHSIRIDPVKVASRVPSGIVAGYSLLKDLGLPLLLGVLAFFFQRSLYERSRVQTVRSALLPTATANAVHYLLPVSSAIGSLNKVTSDAAATEDIDKKILRWRQSFFYFAFLLKRMRDLGTEGGAIFLDNPSSEEIVVACWRAVQLRAIDCFGYLEVSHTMDLMVDHESFSLFMSQLPSFRDLLGKPPSSARIAAMQFRDKFWKLAAGGGLKADLEILGVMGEILQLEVNRLFLGWYEKLDFPSVKTFCGWKDACQAFQTTHPVYAGDLVEKLNNYIADYPWWKRFGIAAHRLLRM
jgi:hypothetical protein